jgi:hypothetical protein
METNKKPKRKLSNIDFSKEGAHIAMCHVSQGVANKQDFALVLKARNFSDEFLEKMQQVRVTMELPDFLTRFFSLYYEDAEILARMMGYERKENEDDTDSYEDYIQSRLESYEILKSASEAENISDVLSDLSEDQYLSILQDQQTIEKAFSKYEKKKQDDEEKAKADKKKPRLKTTRSFENPNSMVSKSESSDVAAATEVETPIASGEVGAKDPVVKQSKEGKSMTQEVKVVEQLVETPVIEKSQYDLVQKQAQEQAELLKTALAELEVFKAEKAALIAKARKQSVLDAVKDADQADLLFKSIQALEDDQFNAVVDVVKSLAAQVEKSDLFVEKGVSVEAEQPVEKESAVAKLIKAKLSK